MHMPSQLSLEFGEYSKRFADRWGEIMPLLQRFASLYTNNARDAFQQGELAVAACQAMGEDCFFGWIRMNPSLGIGRTKHRICLFHVLTNRELENDLTEDQWLAISALLGANSRLRVDLFEQGLMRILSADDPNLEAVTVIEEWGRGKTIPEPPEAEITDKARAILRAAGYETYAEQKSECGARMDLLAVREDGKLLVEVKSKLNMSNLETAVGQLRLYALDAPDHGQVIFYNTRTDETDKALSRLSIDGVRSYDVNHAQAVIKKLRSAKLKPVA
jgi:hypothetical protein